MSAPCIIHLSDLIASEKYNENLLDKYRQRVQDARRQSSDVELLFMCGETPHVHASLVQRAVDAFKTLMQEPLPDETPQDSGQ